MSTHRQQVISLTLLRTLKFGPSYKPIGGDATAVLTARRLLDFAAPYLAGHAYSLYGERNGEVKIEYASHSNFEREVRFIVSTDGRIGWYVVRRPYVGEKHICRLAEVPFAELARWLDSGDVSVLKKIPEKKFDE